MKEGDEKNVPKELERKLNRTRKKNEVTMQYATHSTTPTIASGRLNGGHWWSRG